MKSSRTDAVVVLYAVSLLAISAELTFPWWEAPGKTQANLLSRSSAKRCTALKNSLSLLKFLVIQNLPNLAHKSLISIRSVSGLPGMTLNELPCAWNLKTWKPSDLLLAESHLFEVAFCLAVIVLSKTPKETGLLTSATLQEKGSQTHLLVLSQHFCETEKSGQTNFFFKNKYLFFLICGVVFALWLMPCCQVSSWSSFYG